MHTIQSRAIQPSRIRHLNDLDICRGHFVLYWMQQSQRAEENHALEYAVRQANQLGQGVLVVFGLTDNYPEANLRHYVFMLEGLSEVQASLAKRGIKMVIRKGPPPDVALSVGRKASLIVCDRGYLRHQRQWRAKVAEQAGCRVDQVESDAIIPVEVVSQKAEYAARTIRPKIHRHLHDYLVGIPRTAVRKDTLSLEIHGLDLRDPYKVVRKLSVDQGVPPVSPFFTGGTSMAKKRFRRFLHHHLPRYVENRNQPQTDDISHMSPYLHFGQISPLYLALQIRKVGDPLEDAREAYMEELVVRRGLAINFVNFTDDYDSFACLPEWARKTLKAHQKDKRPHVYTREQLETGVTHDEYWNAAMQEMKHTGFMHNYMRMYWGKKILEWSPTPERSFQTALEINNKYFLDGRDPNSFAGVAWVFGVHDRAWGRRPIFGTIRYMAASGLERKCDIRAYVRKVQKLT